LSALKHMVSIGRHIVFPAEVYRRVSINHGHPVSYRVTTLVALLCYVSETAVSFVLIAPVNVIIISYYYYYYYKFNIL